MFLSKALASAVIAMNINTTTPADPHVHQVSGSTRCEMLSEQMTGLREAYEKVNGALGDTDAMDEYGLKGEIGLRLDAAKILIRQEEIAKRWISRRCFLEKEAPKSKKRQRTVSLDL